MDEEIRKMLEPQKLAFRQLMSELNGKTMDYETCSMLEEFLNDYIEIFLKEMEKALLIIKDKYDLVEKNKEELF